YRSDTVRTLSGLLPPTTISDGSIKSRTAVPSRKNSGLETTLTAGFPTNSGVTTSSQGAGKKGVRMGKINGFVRLGACVAISPTALRNWARPRLPLRSDGVPTQTKATSASASESGVVDAVKRPLATPV